MRMLIWGFAGPTYHIVGNLMSRLNYILSRHRTQSRTFAFIINFWYACLPLIWFGKTSEIFCIQTICKLWERERERERERETSACIRISFNLEKYHVSVGCWKWYFEIHLVRIGFCTTKSDIRQYWRFACFLSHAQMFELTKHSFLNSILIWIRTLTTFFSSFLRERGSKYHKKRAIIGPPEKRL